MKEYSSYDFTSVTSDLSSTFIISGFIVLIGGLLSSFLSAFLFYGVGTIVDIVDANNLIDNSKQVRKNVKVFIAKANVSNEEYVDVTCPNCKEELSYKTEEIHSENLICPMCNTHICIKT